jgi:hypothetical protein
MVDVPSVAFVVSGADPNFGGAAIFCSLDGGTSYEQVGVCGRGTTGTLTADYPAGADPDTTDTLSVNLSESGQTLSSNTQSLADLFEDPVYLAAAAGAFETVCPTTATLTSTENYNLTGYIRRGALQTKSLDHPSGSRFAVLDAAMATIPITAPWVGKTLWFKFAAFNRTGGQQNQLSNCTAYSYTVQGSWTPTSNVTYVQGPTAVESVGQVSATQLYTYPLKGNTIQVGGFVKVVFNVQYTGPASSTVVRLRINGQQALDAELDVNGTIHAEMTIAATAATQAYVSGFWAGSGAVPGGSVMPGLLPVAVPWNQDMPITLEIQSSGTGNTAQGLLFSVESVNGNISL